ncbi:Uncharacterized protein conserved in bacteria [Raoultella ornithinolytica]|nr:Uncharacterized protein conserved in bacteria [Raoultella ornithinolytica]
MSLNTMSDAREILQFWFHQTPPERWFRSDAGFDEQIRHRFSDVHQAALRGELAEWRESSSGRLAEIIVLDQFSRNLFRNSPLSFAADGMALALAQELVKQPDFDQLPVERRDFALLPFMHSESPIIHAAALRLYQRYASTRSLRAETEHKRVIDQFGRYHYSGYNYRELVSDHCHRLGIQLHNYLLLQEIESRVDNWWYKKIIRTQTTSINIYSKYAS